jgi:hypothetical protein
VSDPGPQDLPPLGPRSAAALAAWLLAVTLAYLSVRELGIPLVP